MEYNIVEGVKTILLLLKEVEKDDSITMNNGYYSSLHPLVNAIIYLSNQYLTGQDRYFNMEYIKKNGFNIFPGEVDRFGWLTGCIQLKNGIIVFG